MDIIASRLAIGLLAVSLVASACGLQASPRPHRHTPHAAAVAVETVNLSGTGGMYKLGVAASYFGGSGPRVQLIEMPTGVLWMTPPAFLSRKLKALSGWRLWFTPWRRHGGSLWTNARLLRAFTGAAAGYAIVGDTGQDAVFTESLDGSTKALVVNTATGTAVTLADPITGPLLVEDHFLLYQSGQSLVLDSLPVGSVTTSALPAGAAKQSWQAVSHGLRVGTTLLRLAAIPAMPAFTLPSGFQWLHAIVAVPSGWRVTSDVPGGSSEEFSAQNPANPAERVTVAVNGCTGCSEPDAGLGQVDSVDTPAVGAATWLNDHVTVTSPVTANGMTSENLVAVWPSGITGNIILSWSLPAGDTSLIRAVEASFFATWRESANSLPYVAGS